MAADPVHDLEGDADRRREREGAADAVDATRSSQDPAVVAALPPTFPEALTYILAHPDVALLPFIPEGVAIIPPISDGLSDLITTTPGRRRSWPR